MTLPAGLVMIRGDVRSKINDVFARFQYEPLRTYEISDWTAMRSEIEEELSEEIVRKAVAFANDWTVILDPDMEMSDSEEIWPEIAAKIARPILSVMCIPDSSLSAFFFFNPDGQRRFQFFRGKVSVDEGTPLAEEAGINLKRLDEGGLLQLLSAFGLDLDSLESAGPFEVWEVDESALTMPDDDEDDAHEDILGPAKPWWKFW